MSSDESTNPSGIPTPALHDAVARAYATFRHDESLAFPLDVCLACCCPPEVERELRERPRARLTARHLCKYNDSAKSAVQPVAELRHLLPRLLELIAEGEDVHHSTELYLDRLGRCPEGTWNAQERRVLGDFASAFFDAVLQFGVPGGGFPQRMDGPLNALLMFDIGGIDIGPLLDRWLHCDEPASTIQFVDATYWNFWKDREISCVFASDRPVFRARMREWLLDPGHRSRFAAKMLEPAFLELVVRQPATGCMSFAMMTEAVFDQLTP